MRVWREFSVYLLGCLQESRHMPRPRSRAACFRTPRIEGRPSRLTVGCSLPLIFSPFSFSSLHAPVGKRFHELRDGLDSPSESILEQSRAGICAELPVVSRKTAKYETKLTGSLTRHSASKPMSIHSHFVWEISTLTWPMHST